MRRAPARPPWKAFFAALAITLILALLPARWLGLVSEVAAIVNLPLTPLRDGGSALADWLRPVRSGAESPPPEKSLEQLDEECRRWRQRYMAAEEQIRKLEDQLEQIQKLPVERFGVPFKPVNARITARNTKSPARPAELNRGRQHGIEQGAIAVYNGVHLIGQITEVSAVRSILVPITSAATGLLQARVMGASEEELAVIDAPIIQLRPTGEGTLVADVAEGKPVREGDTVYLFDSAWPQSAQAMIVGNVESIERRDDQPLRQEVVVRPQYQLRALSAVTLIVELPREAPVRPGGAAP